ncbi:hypothetical protein HK101_001147 [Irineochytrium annulatum]|nr:hypothetical protein HK101_001147 [Irineochytrium annulatum]
MVVPAVVSACVVVAAIIGFVVHRGRRARKKVVGEDVELEDKPTTASSKPLPNIPVAYPSIDSKLFRGLEAAAGTGLVVDFKQRGEPAGVVMGDGNAEAGPSNVPTGVMWEKGRDIRAWTVEDVCAWLQENDFSPMRIDAFRENHVDGDRLLRLSDQQMTDDLRMASGGAREMLRVLIAMVAGGSNGGGPSGDAVAATEAAPPLYVAH